MDMQWITLPSLLLYLLSFSLSTYSQDMRPRKHPHTLDKKGFCLPHIHTHFLQLPLHKVLYTHIVDKLERIRPFAIMFILYTPQNWMCMRKSYVIIQLFVNSSSRKRLALEIEDKLGENDIQWFQDALKVECQNQFIQLQLWYSLY